jgi:hypothetical protein
MLVNYLHILGAGIALFLVGINIALLIHVKDSILTWWQFKLAAVTLMLVYIATSLAFGGVGLGRTVFGIIALCIDAVAVWYMWNSILTINGGTFPPVKYRNDTYPPGSHSKP